MKPVYLVLGMHRSGTSAATQLLALAGCGLPKDLVPADDHNARGYFEPWRVAVFNDERLRAATSAWDDPFAFPYREAPDPDAWHDRAAQLLTAQFDLDSAPLLKDPRVSILMPMWRPVFDEAGLSPLCVIPVRHPLEVAGSLAKRDGFVTEKSLLVWCAYMLAAEAYSRGLPRVFVSYDALVRDWRPQAARIEAAHGVKLPRLDDAAAKAIDDFLSPDLRHHQGDRDLASLSPAGALAAPVYDWLVAAARDAAPGPAVMDQAAMELARMAAQMGEIVSSLAHDLDQARADLLYARQLLELEREQFKALREAAPQPAAPGPATALSGAQEREIVAEMFDPAFYLHRNPDVAAAEVDPLQHFLEGGWREGRDPSASFSLSGYLDLNPDVAQTGINPLVHYLLHGRKEGRPIQTNLGFRATALQRALSLEEVVEAVRGTDIPGGPVADLEAMIAALKPELMITVSQDDFTDHVGGVQLCLKRESAGLADMGWNHLHLYPALPLPVADFETLDPVVGVLVDGRGRGFFRTADLAAALGRKAGELEAVSFAVHSLLGHSILAVSQVLEAAGATAGFYWLHDQTSVCASYALLRNDVAYCGAPPPDSQACSVCAYGLRRQVQMAEHAAFFRRFEVTVVAPSQAQLDLWSRATRYRVAAARVHPHATLVRRPAPAGPAADGPLRVAFLGLPGLHKGWPIFQALAARFGDDPRYAFVHLGKRDRPPTPVDFIPVAPSGDELTPMIAAVEAAQVDVALLLSICPETFGFTAYEAAAAGAFVIALPDSSAVARFASDPAFGAVADDEAALAEMFESGSVLRFARALRRPPLFELRYSHMTIDLLGEAAE